MHYFEYWSHGSHAWETWDDMSASNVLQSMLDKAARISERYPETQFRVITVVWEN